MKINCYEIVDRNPRLTVAIAACLLPLFGDMVELERMRWYPKDGELCLGKTKPEETLVEVCSDSDVQIDRQTWV